ncbi:hypothetical protein ACS0TY_021585 [Phlomoides rotata]
MADSRSSGNDLPFTRLHGRRSWSLDWTSAQEAMEHGCSNLMGWPPMCWCDAGPMSIREVGTEKNKGRFFYRCPRNLSHHNSFIWCDIWHQNDPPNMLPPFLKNQTSFVSCVVQPSASSSSFFSHVHNLNTKHNDTSSASDTVRFILKKLVGVLVHKNFCLGCVVVIFWSILTVFLGYFLGQLGNRSVA